LRKESGPTGKVKPVAAAAPAAATAAAKAPATHVPATPTSFGSRPRVIPGLHVPVPAAQANNSQKKPPQASKPAAAAVPAPPAASQPKAAPPAPAPAAVETPEDKEKRAKNLRKKLKQIDEIKAKQASGAVLLEDQVLATSASSI
jgi:hypothetical protein